MSHGMPKLCMDVRAKHHDSLWDAMNALSTLS